MFVSTQVAMAIEHKRAEEARQESEVKYRTMFEASTDAIFLETLEGRVLDCNAAACQMFGYAKEELVKLTVADLVPDQIAATLPDVITQELTTGGIFLKATNRKSNGQVFPVEISTQLVVLGGETRVIAYVRDITDRERAEAALTHRAQEMTALYETSLEISTQLDVSTLLNTIVERTAKLLGARMGALYLLRPDEQMLELVVTYNLPDRYLGTRLRLGEGLSGRIAQTGEPMMVRDHRAWEGRAAPYAESPFRRVLGVPLKVRDKVIGVINVTDDEQTGAFDENEVKVASLFAAQAAVALDNARLFESERQQRALAETLREVGATLAATLDVKAVLDRLLGQISLVVPNDAANVMLVEAGEVYVARWRGYERFGAADYIAAVRFPISGTPNLRQMVETGQPLVIPDVNTFPGWIHKPEEAWLRSYAAAPVRVRGEIVGFLNVDSAMPDFFTSEHAERLRAFADQAAIALGNAQLYEAVQNRARQSRDTERHWPGDHFYARP